MNSFRESITGPRPAGPVMATKPARKAVEENGLGGLSVTRNESRTNNQRSESRQVLTAEEARLFVGRKNYVVDLLNLSGGGAMIRTNVPLKLWKTVQLELGGSDCVECAVRWINGDRIGLEFAHETQVEGDTATRDAMLLDAIERNFPELAGENSDRAAAAVATSADAHQRRIAIRHPLIWSGDIFYDHDTTRVRLRNVSESGAMVDCPRPFPEGAEILLDLGGAGQHFAFVSWSRGDQLGLRFERPFDITCLSRSRPEVATQSWSKPDYLSPGQDADSPWAEPWERVSVSELKDSLEGFLKR